MASMGTHSGSFQCDEALGIWMLRQLPKWADARLVRTRDMDELAKLDIVIDVGGKYEADALRFDHHQRGFFETFDGTPGVATDAASATGEFKTKLSACGLVYKHYGKEILTALHPTLDGPRLDAVYVKLYKDMIEALDGIDNGIEIADETRYREGTGLSCRVGRLNPRWNAPALEKGAAKTREDEHFERASALTGQEFTDVLDELVHSWLPARDGVEEALLARGTVHGSGQVLCFESGGMPWKEHLYALERQHSVDPLVMFVMFTDQAGMWRMQAVTAEGTAFTNRLGLPAAWRGLRDAQLCEVVGLEDCCFVHGAGFIGGHKTREGALAMIDMTLNPK